MSDLLMRRSAVFSECGRYRTRLERIWGPEPPLTFAMLNPSLADAEIDDPTINRGMGFARREKAGGLIVVNMHALISPYPEDLLKDERRNYDHDNFNALTRVLSEGADGLTKIVCAWGAHPLAVEPGRAFVLRACGSVKLFCLGRTKSGAPKHPLYLRADTPLEAYP